MQQRNDAQEIQDNKNGEKAYNADQEKFESQAFFVFCNGFLEHPFCYDYYQPHDQDGNAHLDIMGIVKGKQQYSAQGQQDTGNFQGTVEVPDHWVGLSHINACEE